MKKILLLAVLALALPTAVFAGSSVDFTNSGGNLSGSNSGLTLSGSTLIAVNGLDGLGLVQGNLGTFQLGTGAVMSGSLTSTVPGVIATLSSTGSWFKITGNGTNGIPNGVLFTGSFTGDVTLVLTGTLADGTHDYVLLGQLMTANGASGPTSQVIINTGRGYFNGGARVTSGDTSLSVVVPEPGSLGLLGTGLIGLAGVVRRKLKA
jgi:hypothetical protein